MVQFLDPSESISPQTEAFLRQRAEEHERMAALDLDGRRKEHVSTADCCRRLIEILAPPIERRVRP